MGIRIFAIVLAAVVLSVGWVASCVIWRAAVVGELVAPLAPRNFPRLTVLALGTGGPYENPRRLGPATAIGWHDQVVLVDVGRGIAESLRLAKIPVKQPRRVLLSSLLPMNTLGLDDLVFTGWLADRDAPIEVYGPEGTREFVSGLLAAYALGGEALRGALGLPEAGSRITVEEVDGDFAADWDGLRVTAGSLPGGPTPALAWRFEGAGRSVVVGGTGWAPDALVAFAHGADMLVHEAVYVPPPEDIEAAGVIADPERLRLEAALHTSIMDVGTLARRAEVATLVLVRMRPPPFYDIQVTGFVDDTFDGTILIPEDGDELEP